MGKEEKINQQLLLEVAEKEFLKKGYKGARTVDIAAAAGVTHTMLHYYFGTKEELFNRVFEEKIKVFLDTMRILSSDAELPLLERITKMVEDHFDKVQENRDLPKFLLDELTRDPERMKVFKDNIFTTAFSFFDSFQKDLDEAYKSGEIGKIEALDLAFDILSLNIFSGMVLPLTTYVFGDNKEFVARRRKENVELIIKRIKR